jgi:hypothetical protein
MATIIWNGSTIDWDVAGNWVGGVVPTNLDDIIFDGTSTQDVTDNVDVSADGIWSTARKLTVTPEYTGTIGSSGNPLKMNFNGALSYKGGSGTSEFWFENANATGVLEAKLGPAGQQANACRLDGIFIDVDCLRGKVQFETSATINHELRLLADTQLGGAPIVDVPNGVTVTGVEAFVLDGQLLSDVAWPLLNICGNGRVQHSIDTAATIAEVIQGGGEFVSKLGTVTLYHIHGGKFDGATYSRWVVTTMEASRGAFVDLRNGFGLEPATLNLHPFTTGQVLRG